MSSKLFPELSTHYDRQCTELFYSLILAKLKDKYGENVKVSGIINMAFFPYNATGTGYTYRGEKKSTEFNGVVRMRSTPAQAATADLAAQKNHPIQLADGHTVWVENMPCCTSCSKVVPTLAFIAMAATEVGKKRMEAIEPEKYSASTSLFTPLSSPTTTPPISPNLVGKSGIATSCASASEVGALSPVEQAELDSFKLC